MDHSRNIAGSVTSRKLPRKPGLAPRTAGSSGPRDAHSRPPHGLTAPARLDPINPVTVDAGNIAPGQLSAADRCLSDLPPSTLGKRVQSGYRLPGARRHHLPVSNVALLFPSSSPRAASRDPNVLNSMGPSDAPPFSDNYHERLSSSNPSSNPSRNDRTTPLLLLPPERRLSFSMCDGSDDDGVSSSSRSSTSSMPNSDHHLRRSSGSSSTRQDGAATNTDSYLLSDTREMKKHRKPRHSQQQSRGGPAAYFSARTAKEEDTHLSCKEGHTSLLSSSLDECWLQFQDLPTVESQGTDLTNNNTLQTEWSAEEDHLQYITPVSMDAYGRGRLQSGVLTEEVLREWLGCDDLKHVHSAEIRFDMEEVMGVDQLRSMLPSLMCLRLNGSRIPSIRRLGTRYTRLKVLWLNNCHLGDLRGIGALAPSLSELYVAFNNVTDLTPLLDISSTLEVLDVEGNQIEDVASLRFVLNSLSKVHTLTLQGNPVEDQADMARVVREEEEERIRLRLRDDEAEGDAETMELPAHVADSVSSGNAKVGVAEETEQVSGVESAVRSGEHDELLDVFGGENHFLLFRRWVQLLMPWLQYLDDIPLLSEGATGNGSEADDGASGLNNNMENALRGNGDDDDEDHDRHHGATPSEANALRLGKRRTTSSVHLDQADAALREEMRFVQECIRECGFDNLQQTLLARNESSTGLRPCSASLSSSFSSRHRVSGSGGDGGRLPNGAQRLSTMGSLSHSPSTTVSGRLGSSQNHSPKDSSSLTTGSVLTGSAIRSLRQRLRRGGPPPSAGGTVRENDRLSDARESSPVYDQTHAGLLPSSTSTISASPSPFPSPGSGNPGVGVVPFLSRPAQASPAVTRLNDTADATASGGHYQSAHAGVGEDEEEEDEWERLKADLLRRKLSESTKQMKQHQYRRRYEELRRNGLIPDEDSDKDDDIQVGRRSGMDASGSGTVIRPGTRGEVTLVTEKEDFGSFLKHEVIRTRAQIAKEGVNPDSVIGDASQDFIANQSSFQVMDLGFEDSI